MFHTGNDLYEALIWATIVVTAFAFVTSIGYLVMWIKYSWFKRSNSMNYSGADLTNKIFSENGLSETKVIKKLFYVKFWNHNKRNNTYKLRHWTYNRKSIWTMMEASMQAYATVTRESHKKQFWLAFRLPQMIRFIGLILGMALAGYGVYELIVGSGSDFSKLSNWAKASIGTGISVISLAAAFSVLWRAWILRKNVVPMIANTGLDDYELKAIQRIFNWMFVYAIGQAIMEVLRTLSRESNRYGNNSGLTGFGGLTR